MTKKFLMAVAIVLAGSAVFTSCTKQYNITQTSNGAEALTVRDTLTQSSWSYNSSTNGYYVVLQDTSLTQDITANGAVWIYISLDDGQNYELLPSNYNNGYDFVGIAGDGGFTVYAFPADSTVTAAPNFQIIVKEVNIPSSLQNKAAGVNVKDYNAVKKAFNLKD